MTVIISPRTFSTQRILIPYYYCRKFASENEESAEILWTRCGGVAFSIFGFAPSESFGISCEYHVPEGVFMIVELQPGFLDGVSGKVNYHSTFSNA